MSKKIINKGMIPDIFLYEKIAEKTGLDSGDVSKSVVAYFEEVIEQLSYGQRVSMQPFGSVYIAELDGNPSGSNLQRWTPRRFIPQFSPFKDMQKAVLDAGKKHLEELLTARLKNCVKNGPFKFSSGIASPYKIVLDSAVRNKSTVDLITELIVYKLIEKDIQLTSATIVGQKSNGDVIAKDLARKLRLPYAVFDKKEQKVIGGEYASFYFLVDDVSTTDASMDLQKRILKENHNAVNCGGTVGGIVIVANQPDKTKYDYLLSAKDLLK
jgi:orotate phosphoribosyltransferase/nucleoid DNA-binding protein